MKLGEFGREMIKRTKGQKGGCRSPSLQCCSATERDPSPSSIPGPFRIFSMSSATSTPVPMGLLCLALLLAFPALGLNCRRLQRLQQRWNLRSMELLKGMEARLPPECLRKMPAVSFPVEILGTRQPRAATKAVLEMLWGLLNLLEDHHRWVAWKAASRKRFLERLHGQAHKVERCLQEGTPKPGASKEERMLKLQLKKYFRSLGDYVEEQGLDGCTQEFVRQEIEVDLTYMDQLTERMAI